MRVHVMCARIGLCLALVLVTACGSSGDGGVNSPPAGPGYQVTVSPSAETAALGGQVSVQVDLASDSFAGEVTLSVTGVPDSWQAVFSPSPVVMLAAHGTASAELLVTIPTNGEAAPDGLDLVVAATATAGRVERMDRVTVPNQYAIHVAAGTGNGAHWGALTNGVLHLRAGVVLTFVNDDADPHRIHTDNNVPGLPHEASSMQTGESYGGTLGVGRGDIYCHDHALIAGKFTLIVE